jgi:uncharacterized protein (TIGR03089 family)
MPTSPEALYTALVSTAPSRPFVTFYDEAGGERTELSVRSLANWVAKTHFLLTDELGLGVGDSAHVDLPVHWIAVPVLLGCWTAGLEVRSDPNGAAVAFVAGSAPTGPADTYAVALESAARGFGTAPPPGTSDYVASVRPQPDVWTTVHPPASHGDPALDGASRADVVVRAKARAAELDLDAGARILTTRDDWLDALLVPLAIGGSVVIVRNAEPDVVARRAEQERVSRLL